MTQTDPENTTPHAHGIGVHDALETIVQVRGDRHIVLTNQVSSRLWPTLSDHPLDLNYNPSAMGGAIPLGLGLALAQPDYEIIVLSGDGSLLMNLGCLVTVVDSGATNLSIVLLDNGQYEVTGGQKTPGYNGANYAGLARASGFPCVHHFTEAATWQNEAASSLSGTGPRFVWLTIRPQPGDYGKAVGRPIQEQMASLRQQFRADVQ